MSIAPKVSARWVAHQLTASMIIPAQDPKTGIPP
jgi:hypothetical protein